ncbi:lysophospholipid acyltransferase family protein [Limoniibacter endophyticus]|uniref:1-acyl-sn-glycerol-3-phosphate acyltransferase n=1 Tax=Limoniibacter endophyticus TaxID=1565040 RepID=A0A8J3DKF9_9HYPH|nr:1-acyl-sn-glycerol-3-phosphate acyltransferase [Limoniibacter endophyticus]GHC76313.1 1-acyl-sn-glycerol-3-phosphate acyltransferase [Limoniibacter endophyticus]
MLILRSVIFNTAFYLNLILQMILWTPFYFLAPRHLAWIVPRFWSWSSQWLHKVLAGTQVEIEGLEHLPEGAFILAPKHQSFWDTIAFFPYLKDPVYILKRELMWIPVFGWYVKKMRMIPVNRAKKGGVLRTVAAAAREEIADTRQLIIYPEGTRRAPGAAPAYKWGVAELYSQLNLPVVPVAHVAGLFWPRRKFLRFPGTIKARFLPAIEAGLSKEEFMARLIQETEAGCDEILMETAAMKDCPPLPPTAQARLSQLREEAAAGVS